MPTGSIAAAPTGPTPSDIPFTRAVAFMNQKGGVGKTTTAVNLAAAVALLGKRALLVDLDPQAHSTLHLGIDLAVGQPTAYDVLVEPDATLAAAIVESRPNLWVLPSHTDLASAELDLASVASPARFTRLRDAIERHAAAGAPFDYVFIDCPPSLGVLTLSGLAAAREVMVPMQAHFLALQGLGKLMETVAEVVKAVNPRLRVTGVIICQHDSTTTHSREVVADLDAFFEQSRGTDKPWRAARVYRPAVRRNIKMAECPSFGQTIFEYAPTCPGAADYRALAQIVVNEWDQFRAAKTRASTTLQPAATVPPPGPAVVVPAAAAPSSAASAAP
jgi:chromosome partitioning protein